jgi:hypothetical protein
MIFNCQKDTDSITGLDGNDTTGYVVRKPNIYIYPTEKTELSVKLKFPKGGKILESVPLYTNCWQIQVESSGLINGEYRYLFYEARIPEILQRESGWVLEGNELEDFFKENLTALTFSEPEINDFLDYWLPYFSNESTYIVYPLFAEDLKEIIELNFSLPPDHINRVIYLIEEYTGNVTVKNPENPTYEREGFTVLEWGVIYQ